MPSTDRRLTLAIVSALQSREVGITPKIAGSLARVIVSKGNYLEVPWTNVIYRLQETVKELAGVVLPSDRFAATIESGLLFHSSIRYTIYRLALPLVQAGCALIGMRMLICEDDVETSVSYEEFEKYERALENAIITLTEEKSLLPDVFWQDSALTLLSTTQQRRNRETAGNEVTSRSISTGVNSILDAAVILRMSHAARIYRDETPAVLRPARQRTLIDPRLSTAGTDGVRVSHAISDLPRMLLTELLYPEIIRYDRILNSGFWVTKPPPKPIQQRDVLVVGVAPKHEGPLQTFIKACWQEFALRLTSLLVQSDLTNSEIRWVEADSAKRMSVTSLMLRDLQTSGQTIAQETILRFHLWRTSGWYPTFFTNGQKITTLDRSKVHPHTSVPAQIEAWVREAWQQQRETVRWRAWANHDLRKRRQFRPTTNLIGFETTALQLNLFSFVYVLLFLPSSLRGMVGGFKTWFSPSPHTVAVTWIPEDPGTGSWKVDGAFVTDDVSGFSDAASGAEVVNGLIAAWLNDLAEELRRV